MQSKYTQLAFAREYRGLSQTELAERVPGLSQSNLSKFEKGIDKLSSETVSKILGFLNFPDSWLEQTIGNLPTSAHYRKRTTIRLIGFIADQMSKAIEWPDYFMLDFESDSNLRPEQIAESLRDFFGIPPNAPVREICNLLESHGIIIVEYRGHAKFDGVSFMSDNGNPIIVINKEFSNDRKRYTIAHELGHLVLHQGTLVSNMEKENEANQFASEFLMPGEIIRHSLKDLRLSRLGELKRYWLTSMQSLVRRAYDLDCINSDRYQYLNIELSRNGGKKKEPIEVPLDRPRLFFEAYKLFEMELNYSDEDFVDAFHLPDDVIKRFCLESNLRIV
jgi:Zn-dependent peptidase ImmA (M78 family)/DNA-binding XRE family transcriptional regulator